MPPHNRNGVMPLSRLAGLLSGVADKPERAMVMKRIWAMTCAMAAGLVGSDAAADIIAIDCHWGAEACLIAPDQVALPNPVRPDPNDGLLLVWREQQNVLLPRDVRVNRVLTQNAAFNGPVIRAGTVVSSYYLQWDPLHPRGRVSATLQFDDTVAAAITEDHELFATDPVLGLPTLDYADFTLRGLEPEDEITFDGTRVDIVLRASSPGDWVRLITLQTAGSIEDNLAGSCGVTVAVPLGQEGGSLVVLPPADQRLAEFVGQVNELFGKSGPAPRIDVAAGTGASAALADAVATHLIEHLGVVPELVRSAPDGASGRGCVADASGARVVTLTVVPLT